MPVSRPRPVLRATRRTTVVTASLAVLAGCRFGPAEHGSDAEPEPDVDAGLVTQGASALALQTALLDAVAQAHLGLAVALRPVTEAHRAHLALLGGGPDDSAVGTDATTGGTPEVSGSAKAALAQVRAGETALQGTLTELAVGATSGTLARALASMSASTTQHLATLPTVTGGPA